MHHFQQAGDTYGSFKVTYLKEIPEIQSTLIELQHQPTGAQILHIANEDEENLFNLSFRTHPSSSNGVAHILEHTVLCGSEKFPVKDPFFSMSRRSLNTFMNALTGPDFTCYPASSQVKKDFYNLLEVYLDAVFHPTLSKLSFLQEGHRLEFMQPEDPHSPLIFKGVVFNEMKGALATPEARLGEALMRALFPDLTYGVNSGGDPMEIITLSYEELKEFHAQFYHPSRCLFYFYGNLPLTDHLDFLEKHAFASVQKLPSLPYLPKQSRFLTKVTQNLPYPIYEEGDLSEKTLIGMAWLTCSILEQEELLALIVLDVALAGTDAAPLKMALLKSNLCKQADSSIESEMSEIPFLIVCKGCAKESAEALEQLVRSTLQQLVEEGIPDHLIEAAIHQIEMARTEITGSSSPYGLSLFWRSALLKQHGGSPEDGLKIHTLFHQLEEKAKDRNYFPQLIKKYFLNNPHFVRIALHPSPALATQERLEEEEKLLSLKQSLQKSSIQNILKETKELTAQQESTKEEKLSLLPKVNLTDVNQEGKEFDLLHEQCGSLELYTHSCFTNGLTYAELIFDLPYFEEKELPFLRLFSLLLPQVGCGGRGYEQHLEYLLEHTGGIGASLDLYQQAEDGQAMRPAFSLRGKTLNRKLDKFFPIFREMMLSADFTDEARLKELLMQHLHGLENSIQHHSLRYAVNLAARGFSVASKIASSWYGLDYFWSLQEIVKEFHQNSAFLIQKLQEIQSRILSLQGGTLVLSCDEGSLNTLKKESFFGLNALTTKKSIPWRTDYPLAEKLSQARIITSPVAFTAMVLPSVSYTHPSAAALSLASEIMESCTLHKKIREQGGAYGGGAVNHVLSKQFYFYAYRDPHLKSTLKAFREAVAALVSMKFNDEDLEEAKLALFQDLDSPTPPGSRASTAYSRLRCGRSPECRQRFREALLKCQKKEIQQVAKEILTPGIEESVVTCFASKEFLDKENPLLKEKALPIYLI